MDLNGNTNVVFFDLPVNSERLQIIQHKENIDKYNEICLLQNNGNTRQAIQL